jgi:heme-degrading monooxygenase HmoA
MASRRTVRRLVTMKSRWKQLAPLEPEREYLALASWIPPRSRRSTWRLFRGSRAVAGQLGDTEGAIGFSMLARPVRKEYATLSLWTGSAALDAFARSSAHERVQGELSSQMNPTTFVRWTVRGKDGIPTWSEALERLTAQHAPNR